MTAIPPLPPLSVLQHTTSSSSIWKTSSASPLQTCDEPFAPSPPIRSRPFIRLCEPCLLRLCTFHNHRFLPLRPKNPSLLILTLPMAHLLSNSVILYLASITSERVPPLLSWARFRRALFIAEKQPPLSYQHSHLPQLRPIAAISASTTSIDPEPQPYTLPLVSARTWKTEEEEATSKFWSNPNFGFSQLLVVLILLCGDFFVDPSLRGINSRGNFEKEIRRKDYKLIPFVWEPGTSLPGPCRKEFVVYLGCYIQEKFQ